MGAQLGNICIVQVQLFDLVEVMHNGFTPSGWFKSLHPWHWFTQVLVVLNSLYRPTKVDELGMFSKVGLHRC